MDVSLSRRLGSVRVLDFVENAGGEDGTGRPGLQVQGAGRRIGAAIAGWTRRYGRNSHIAVRAATPYLGHIRTLYKKKADKVRPISLGKSSAGVPPGNPDWKDELVKESRKNYEPGKYDKWFEPKFSGLERGSRLTPDRLSKLVVGDGLTSEELEIFHEMLFYREKALAFDFTHRGKVRPEVSPPQIIDTIDHDAWQSPGFPVPKALLPTVVEMIQERLDSGILEYCQGPYRNSWFLTRKKEKKKYRLINGVIKMNAVTIRDANAPPSVDEFSEEFAGCRLASLVDFFSGYDQVELHERCRDMTAMMTPLGLVRQTTLPQGATNSVSQFQRVMTRILKDHIPKRAMPFLDDIGVKGPTSTYEGEEVEPGVRRFVLEHIQNLSMVLADIERAGCTIGPKSQFCMNGINAVGFVCTGEGRKPGSTKVADILEWEPCRDISDARAFIGICVYFRIFVEHFAQVAGPIYFLFKKGVAFSWENEQQEAMDKLKMALTTAPALITLVYTDGAGEIILAVDASLKGWGAVLMQIVDGIRHPSRYESGMWSVAESKYDATKRECRGVLKALKKTKPWLYGVHFTLETDANVLVAQLNRGATDLPGALVTRWLAWIRLFDFDVRHVPGKKHTAADGLSRRPRLERDSNPETDIDDFIASELECLQIAQIYTASATSSSSSDDESSRLASVLEGHNWSEKSRKIALYLTTLKRPHGLSAKEFSAFKQEALRFLVQRKTLFRRQTKNTVQTRVVDDLKERALILKQLHDEAGHKGREATYRKIADRYYWKDCYKDCSAFVRSCDRCQLFEGKPKPEALFATWSSAVWQRVGVDIIYMPPRAGKKFLVVARCDLSGWVEGRPLASATAANVAKFIWEDVVCRHGLFGKLMVDGGPENKGLVKAFTKKYGIKRVVISAYNSKANGMIERGHRSLKAALAKMTDGGEGSWLDNLHAVLLADRCTVKSTTGFTPFYILYGREAVLPIEITLPTWRVLKWDEAHTTEDLLRLRARQLQRRDEDMEEARLHQQRKRLDGKDRFDTEKSLRRGTISNGDIVLLHDAVQEIDKSASTKLSYRWLGPFRISQADQTKGTYLLEELDGTKKNGTYAGSRLKKFVLRHGLFEPEDTEEEEEEAEPLPGPGASSHGTANLSEGEEIEEHTKENTRKTTLRGAKSRKEEIDDQKNRRKLIPTGRKFAVVV